MNCSTNPTALQSRRWIIEALLYLMRKTDFDNIRVSSICRRAQLDRRTFYRHFTSKDDILKQYIEGLGSEYLTELADAGTRDVDTAVTFFRFWKKHLSFIRSLPVCGLTAFTFSRFEVFVKSHLELLGCGRETDVQSGYPLTYRIGGFWNVLLTWASDGAEATPEELAACAAAGNPEG